MGDALCGGRSLKAAKSGAGSGEVLAPSPDLPREPLSARASGALLLIATTRGSSGGGQKHESFLYSVKKTHHALLLNFPPDRSFPPYASSSSSSLRGGSAGSYFPLSLLPESLLDLICT